MCVLLSPNSCGLFFPFGGELPGPTVCPPRTHTRALIYRWACHYLMILFYCTPPPPTSDPVDLQAGVVVGGAMWKAKSVSPDLTEQLGVMGFFPRKSETEFVIDDVWLCARMGKLVSPMTILPIGCWFVGIAIPVCI